jgi:zinc transporter 2
MEGTPKQLNFDEVRNDLRNVHGVKKVHNMHTWSLTTNKTALDVHLAIQPRYHSQDVLDAATKMLVQKYRFYKTTIQVETYRDAMETCVRCKDI